jgi:ketosteroid isomerase-like protein
LTSRPPGVRPKRGAAVGRGHCPKPASRNSKGKERSGTQSGPLVTPSGEIPASGKPIEIQAAFWCTVRNGRVTEIHNYVDMLTMLQQIGALG